MITYPEYSAFMQRYENAINAASTDGFPSVNVAGKTATETTLCQMGRFVQIISRATDLQSDLYEQQICEALAVILRLMRSRQAIYSIGIFPVEDVDADADRDLYDWWVNSMTEYARMTPVMLIGHTLMLSNQLDTIALDSDKDIIYWCNAQLDAIANFTLMHDIDIIGIITRGMAAPANKEQQS